MDCDYDNELFEKSVKGLENEPEGGRRSAVCFSLRLDKTAEIARSCGAICYERTNPLERTKGYALRYLIEQIKRD